MKAFLIFRDDADNVAETSVGPRDRMVSLAVKARDYVEKVTIVTVGDSLSYQDVNANGSLGPVYL